MKSLSIRIKRDNLNALNVFTKELLSDSSIGVEILRSCNEDTTSLNFFSAKPNERLRNMHGALKTLGSLLDAEVQKAGYRNPMLGFDQGY